MNSSAEPAPATARAAAPVVTRFAPSPTGFLHLGHAWSAMLSARLARRHGGQWLLRIEDIDSTRCRPEFIDSIHADLDWLGLTPDQPPLLQSARRHDHAEALRKLTDLGVTYPCFCTRHDIATAASAPHGMTAAYPGTCRRLEPVLAARRAEREPHAIRLDVARALALTGPLHWLEGTVAQPADARRAGDVVLARKDIGIGYLLAAVVDDGFQQVTDVVRGHDLVDVTATQRLLQALLGLPAPLYHHHRLLLGADGKRLAKRDRAATLASLRTRGVDGRALAQRLAELAPDGADICIGADFNG